MKYGITSDREDWTDRDIIVTIFSDGTARVRNKDEYLTPLRSPLHKAIKNAENWLRQEAHHYQRIMIHLLIGDEASDESERSPPNIKPRTRRG